MDRGCYVCDVARMDCDPTYDPPMSSVIFW